MKKTFILLQLCTFILSLNAFALVPSSDPIIGGSVRELSEKVKPKPVLEIECGGETYTFKEGDSVIADIAPIDGKNESYTINATPSYGTNTDGSPNKSEVNASLKSDSGTNVHAKFTCVDGELDVTAS